MASKEQTVSCEWSQMWSRPETLIIKRLWHCLPGWEGILYSSFLWSELNFQWLISWRRLKVTVILEDPQVRELHREKVPLCQGFEIEGLQIWFWGCLLSFLSFKIVNMLKLEDIIVVNPKFKNILFQPLSQTSRTKFNPKRFPKRGMNQKFCLSTSHRTGCEAETLRISIE